MVSIFCHMLIWRYKDVETYRVVEDELLWCPWGEEALPIGIHLLLHVIGDGGERGSVAQDLVKPAFVLAELRQKGTNARRECSTP